MTKVYEVRVVQRENWVRRLARRLLRLYRAEHSAGLFSTEEYAWAEITRLGELPSVGRTFLVVRTLDFEIG